MARQLTLEEFASPDYQLTGRLGETPHIGARTIEILGQQGIHSTYQLLGHYLTLNRDNNDFVAFLEMVETPEAHRSGLADAIARRVELAGVKVTVAVPQEIDGKPVSTKLDNDRACTIQRTEFNGDLRHDFPGCGFGKVGDLPNQTVKNLADHGITNTDELFGAMLSHFDAAPTEAHMIAFWKALGAMGAAHGYKTTIIHAMKLKLDIGIDNCAPRRLSTQAEQEELPAPPRTPPATRQQAPAAATPNTGQQSRVRQNVPLSPPPPPASTPPAPTPPAPTPPTSTPSPRQQSLEGPRSKLPTGLIVGALAVGLVGIGYLMMYPAATSSAIAVHPRSGFAMEYE